MTSCATRSAVSRAACSAVRSALVASATAVAGVVVAARLAAFDADFLALVAFAGAFDAALVAEVFLVAGLFDGDLLADVFLVEVVVAFLAAVAVADDFLAAVAVTDDFLGDDFFVVVFFAAGRVDVFFEVARVSAMVLSIRASRPWRNRATRIGLLNRRKTLLRVTCHPSTSEVLAPALAGHFTDS